MSYRYVETPNYRLVDQSAVVPSARVQRDTPSLTTFLDVIGGLIFAVVISALVIRFGVGLYVGEGWGSAIGFESVWMVVVLLCSHAMPSGIQHTISLRSTLRGIGLDWPELVIACYIFYEILQMPIGDSVLKPLSFALSVGAGEEFLFRVLILGWLVTKMDAPKALLVSAAVFGMAHIHEFSVLGFMSIVPQFSGGVVLGAVYLRTRNPLGGILSHAFWDFPFFLAAGGQDVSGGGTEAGMPSVLYICFWMMMVWYGLFLVRTSRPLDLTGPETENAKVFGH